MEDTIVTPNQIVNGGCAFADDCRCKMFRSPLLSEPYTCFRTHDISQHEMIGVVDGCVTRYFGPAAVVPTPATPIIPKDTVEAQVHLIDQADRSVHLQGLLIDRHVHQLVE